MCDWQWSRVCVCVACLSPIFQTLKTWLARFQRFSGHTLPSLCNFWRNGPKLPIVYVDSGHHITSRHRLLERLHTRPRLYISASIRYLFWRGSAHSNIGRWIRRVRPVSEGNWLVPTKSCTCYNANSLDCSPSASFNGSFFFKHMHKQKERKAKQQTRSTLYQQWQTQRG